MSRSIPIPTIDVPNQDGSFLGEEEKAEIKKREDADNAAKKKHEEEANRTQDFILGPGGGGNSDFEESSFNITTGTALNKTPISKTGPRGNSFVVNISSAHDLSTSALHPHDESSIYLDDSYSIEDQGDNFSLGESSAISAISKSSVTSSYTPPRGAPTGATQNPAQKSPTTGTLRKSVAELRKGTQPILTNPTNIGFLPAERIISDDTPTTVISSAFNPFGSYINNSTPQAGKPERPSVRIGQETFMEPQAIFGNKQQHTTAHPSSLISEEEVNSISLSPALSDSHSKSHLALTQKSTPPQDGSPAVKLLPETTSTNLQNKPLNIYEAHIAEIKKTEQLNQNSVRDSRPSRSASAHSASTSAYRKHPIKCNPIVQHSHLMAHIVAHNNKPQDIVDQKTTEIEIDYLQSDISTQDLTITEEEFTTTQKATNDLTNGTPAPNLSFTFPPTDLQEYCNPSTQPINNERLESAFTRENNDFIDASLNPLNHRKDLKTKDLIIKILGALEKATFDNNNIYFAALQNNISKTTVTSNYYLTVGNAQLNPEYMGKALFSFFDLNPSENEQSYTLGHRTIKDRSILEVSRIIEETPHVDYFRKDTHYSDTLLIAQALGVEKHYLNSWSISDNGFLPKESSDLTPSKTLSEATAATLSANQNKFLYCTPIKSEGVWDEPHGEKRGTKFKALESVYREDTIEELYPQKEDIKKTIESTLLCIIAKIAENPVITTSLGKIPSINDIIKLIEAAQNNGGISNKLKEDGNYEKQKEAIAPWKKKFSKLFQEECKACGIYSGRNTATTSHGMRLTHLPLSALNTLKAHKEGQEFYSEFQISDLADSVDLEEKKDLVRKKIIPQTHYTQL